MYNVVIYIYVPITACVYNNISIKHVRNVVCAYNWFIHATMYSSGVCLVHMYMYMYMYTCLHSVHVPNVCVCTCVHVQAHFSIPDYPATIDCFHNLKILTPEMHRIN